jgi:hypothetical protein
VQAGSRAGRATLGEATHRESFAPPLEPTIVSVEQNPSNAGHEDQQRKNDPDCEPAYRMA